VQSKVCSVQSAGPAPRPGVDAGAVGEARDDRRDRRTRSAGVARPRVRKSLFAPRVPEKERAAFS